MESRIQQLWSCGKNSCRWSVYWFWRWTLCCFLKNVGVHVAISAATEVWWRVVEVECRGNAGRGSCKADCTDGSHNESANDFNSTIAVPMEVQGIMSETVWHWPPCCPPRESNCLRLINCVNIYGGGGGSFISPIFKLLVQHPSFKYWSQP